MSKQRFSPKQPLVRGPGGRNLCRCGCGREAQPPRRTFFSADCVHQYLLRRSGSYLRRCVRERDHTVCAACRLDCNRLRRRLRKALGNQDTTLVQELKKAYPRLRAGRTYWEAHHITAVVNGGGESSLDNLQTLCLECHLVETRALRKTLRQKSS